MKKLDLKNFSKDFFNLTKNWDWEIEGFADKNGYIYPIDSDTKVLSTVFERLSSPVLRTIGKQLGYKIEIANQTTYPDFTLTLSNKNLLHRIAIDIKTTYLKSTMSFTLGAYNSFLKNNTKNILYPYDTYDEHWVIGFIYEQKNNLKEYDLKTMPKIGETECPYKNVFVFIRDKYEICGLRAGSGNTKNIGSIKLKSVKDFTLAKGPFTQFAKGKNACDFYWVNYGKYKKHISNDKDLISHKDFNQFK